MTVLVTMVVVAAGPMHVAVLVILVMCMSVVAVGPMHVLVLMIVRMLMVVIMGVAMTIGV
jgi:hypothetical protein